MMTAFADIATTVSAVKAGAHGFLTKPFVSNESVVIEVLNAAQFRRLRERTEHLQRELVGATARRRDGRQLRRRCARCIDASTASRPTNSTILVLGESGTGKELVARAIHDRSRRAGKPMVTVNCAAIPKELVESELFGHTRGAFTSAQSPRAPGSSRPRTAARSSSTRSATCPPSAQVKLLRTLQSGEIKPVGSDTVKTVDVRVVAATNVDLKAAIAAGTFRQDLFYRLNVIAVRLPSLRERGDDILLLAHHFIQKHAQLAGTPGDAISAHEAAAPPAALRVARQRARARARDRARGRALRGRRRSSRARFRPRCSASTEALAGVGVAGLAATSRAYGLAAVPGAPSCAALEPPISPAPSVRRPWTRSSRRSASPAWATPTRRSACSPSSTTPTSVRSCASTTGNMSEAARRSGLDRSNFRRLVRTTSVDVGAASTRNPSSDPTTTATPEGEPLTEARQGDTSAEETHLWTGPPRRVLVLDDDQLIVRAVARMLRSVGLTVEGTTDADEALAIATRDPPHAVISDLHMPQACGAKVLAAIATIAPSAMRVLMSADPDFEPRVGSLAEARVHALMNKVDLRKLSGVLVEQLRGRDTAAEESSGRVELAKNIARALARPAHEDDGHRERVVRWTASLASAMGLSPEEVEHARLGAILHDVGQVTIRHRVLARSGPLSPNEREHMATHAEAGARIVADMPALRAALPVIRHHHERQDGTGYPMRASGSEISAAVCAFQVVDAYDAMTCGRAYAAGRSHRDALQALAAGAGAQHGCDAVAALEALGEDGLAAALQG